MQLFIYLRDHSDYIQRLAVEHIMMVSVVLSISILLGVVGGVLLTKFKNIGELVIYLTSVIFTIPSIALYGFMLPSLAKIGHGIGFVPAVLGAIVYAVAPILRNTYSAINDINPSLREAAQAMGMNPYQRFMRVEMPLALPAILAGIRVSTVLGISIVSIATFIGAGGLGDLINRGISQTDLTQVAAGALVISLMAISADLMLSFGQRLSMSRGLKANG